MLCGEFERVVQSNQQLYRQNLWRVVQGEPAGKYVLKCTLQFNDKLHMLAINRNTFLNDDCATIEIEK